MQNCATPLCKIANPYHATDQKRSNGDLQPAAITKSVGSIENFLGSKAVVRRMLYDYCMEVMWNAVFYDTVAEYSSFWRKRKLWSGHILSQKPSREIGDYIKAAKQSNVS